MKRLMILALTALFLGTADVSAQTIIKGVVKDSISGESEPYATVRVFKVTDMEKAVAMSLTDIDGKIKQEIVEGMKLKSQSLPLFLVCDTFNRVVYIQQGYTINIGEHLLKVTKKLK